MLYVIAYLVCCFAIDRFPTAHHLLQSLRLGIFFDHIRITIIYQNVGVSTDNDIMGQ